MTWRNVTVDQIISSTPSYIYLIPLCTNDVQYVCNVMASAYFNFGLKFDLWTNMGGFLYLFYVSEINIFTNSFYSNMLRELHDLSYQHCCCASMNYSNPG